MSDQPRHRRPRRPPPAAPPASRGLVGQLVAGRYRIEARLASGGFGAVYTGKHVHMGHRVAVKVLHPQAENLPGLVERFRREAIVGAHVRHPNVASAIDYGMLQDGSYYLVLEHAGGATLKEALKEGRLAVEQAVAVARQLAEALDAVHAMGIVHRDVKPANIMLLRESRRGGPRLAVKLIDFGFAKVAPDQLATVELPEPIAALGDTALTVDGMVFGTVAYIAPEAFHGMERVDARSDLYAIGLILYEMLTGKRPFVGKTDAEVFMHKLQRVPEPLARRGLVGPLFEELDGIIACLLHRDPNQRFQAAQQVIEALDRLALDGGEETDAREAAPSEAEPAPSEAVPEAEPAPSEAVPEAEPAPSDAVPEAESAPSEAVPEAEPGRMERDEESQADAAAAEATEEPSAPPVSETGAGARAEGSVGAGRPKRTMAWAAVAIGLAALGAAVLLLRATPSGEPAAVARPHTLPAASRQTAASAASSTALAASASVIPSASVSRAQVRAWRHRLEAAARVRDWTSAYRAFEALARIDPAVLSEPLVRAAAASTLSALAQSGVREAEAMMVILERGVGFAGPDVLFHVVQFHGGSRARERALASLAKPQVQALTSPELRLALELWRAGCKTSSESLRQAVQVGDGRALMVLNVQRSTCRTSPERDMAYRRLEARLTRH